jgi:hypothetical protein
MNRPAVLIAALSIAAGVVAVFVARAQHDNPVPGPGASATATHAPRLPEGPHELPAHDPSPSPPQELPHDLAEIMGPDGPPASGPGKLQYMRIQLGSTNAALTLVEDQIAALRSLTNPTREQREALTHADEQLKELVEKAARQQRDIDAFDVHAPPPRNDSHPRTGTPMKLTAALSLKQEEWTLLASQHFSPNARVSTAALRRLDRQLADARDFLASVEIPSGLASKAQEEFLPVLDAVMQGETTTDRTAAEQLIAARWKEFVAHIRALAAGHEH